jgi:hypothetical protein
VLQGDLEVMHLVLSRPNTIHPLKARTKVWSMVDLIGGFQGDITLDTYLEAWLYGLHQHLLHH